MTRPNILLIVVHDLGTQLGCYGKRTVDSPNLDVFAEEGVRFVNHFATATFCSPSRGSIITGKYPHSSGLMGLVNLGWNLPKHNVSMAQLLGAAGYETFLFGLQHEVKDVAQLGFHHVPQCASRNCADVSPVIADFLKERAGANVAPFYARVGFFEVHRFGDGYQRYGADAPDPDSIDVPPFLKDTPGAREDLAQFHVAIREMDSGVGTILRALDESGLADNTIVVFTNDHGIDFPRAKGTVYDAGINTVLLMRWRSGISGGRTRTELLSNIDLLPTLLEAADVPVPEDVDGRSFLPLLLGRPYEPKDAIFAEKNTVPQDSKRAIRTSRWKYIRNYDEGPLIDLTSGMRTSLTGRDLGGEHLAPRPATELYDLEADPNELDSLSGKPEIEAIERTLAGCLHDWMTETNDPRLHGPISRPEAEAEFRRRVRERVDEWLRERGA